MSNAVYAMRAANGRGTLYIRLFRSGEELSIQVDDDGPGIPAAYLGRIFDPFFTTKKVGEGTGLGLSLSHGIVESHGGRMRAENLPGAGARFTIVLPITEVRASEPRTEASVTPSGAARILVVDDEAGLGTVLSDTLRGLGHDVEVAASGQDARERLERTNYDVIALDLRLPDVSGREIWRWIVSNKSILSSRVVFMTGDILSPETTAFLEGAGRPVLTKPIALRPLARAIEDIRAGDGARPATRSDTRSVAATIASLSPTDAER
jgi:CheY-like chemotaxis protein